MTVGVTSGVTGRYGCHTSTGWNLEAVWEREVEAQDTILRLPRDRLAGFKTAWPAIVRDFVDAVAAEEIRQKDGCPFDPSWARLAPPAARAIDRMQEVWTWHERYLSKDAIGCQIVQGMALATALHRPLLWGVRHFLRQRRWQCYRIRDRALTRVAAGLSVDGIAFYPLIAP